MASPFNVFRRNQKLLLAIVAIGAMVAFVFLDPLMRIIGNPSRTRQNPVVVKTRYGALTEMDLDNVRRSRELVEVFLRAVTTATVDAEMKKGTLDPRMHDRIAENFFRGWRQALMERSNPGHPEDEAIETLILHKKAEQLGMVVSDRAINDVLKRITNNSLTSETLQAVIASLPGQRRVTAARLFDAIRQEMLASQLLQLFGYSLRDIPPAQRFEQYERLHRRAKVEIVPLAVKDFTSQVADPKPDVLQAFYEQYKDRLPNPTSPEPGFKQAQRVAFEYFKADFAKFKDQFKPQVTEEEVKTYYEANKAQFRAFDKPPETKDEEAKEGEPGAEKASEEKPAAEEDKPRAEKPADEKPADAKPDEQPQASTSVKGTSPIRLVSATLLDEPPTQDPPKDDAGAKPPADAAAEKSDVPAERPSESPETPTDQKPADEIKYEPLEKVQDTIRDTIAGQKASEHVREIFDRLSAELRRYSEELDTYKASKQGDSKGPPPKPFPIAELAKENNLEAREVPLVTAAEMAQEDLGKVARLVQDPSSQLGFRRETFAEFAFATSAPLYRSSTGQDDEGNAYLFWKTKEEPAYVPTLADIHDKVVQAWKMIQARELARKRADEYAAQARVVQKPLKEVFANQTSLQVSETPYFTWLTVGAVPFDLASSMPRLSQVEGVEHVGTDFMKTVFGLAQGQVGVATNHPQDTVYVVRLAKYEQPVDALRTDFASEPQQRYMLVAETDNRRVYRVWLDDLKKEARVTWVRPADSTSRRGPQADMPIEEDYDL